MSDPLSLTKHSVAIRISREMAVAFGHVEPTPEEAAESAAAAQRHREAQAHSWALYDAARPLLDAIDAPVARSILDMHGPSTIERPQCTECDGGDDYAMWPCPTVERIAAHYDIDMPDPWHLWRRPEEQA